MFDTRPYKERLEMRVILVLIIGLAIAFWLDQRYNHGLYSNSLADMLHHIAVSFK